MIGTVNLPLREISNLTIKIDNFFKLLVLIMVLGSVALTTLASIATDQRYLLVPGLIIFFTIGFLVVIFIGVRYRLFFPLPPESAPMMAIDIFKALQGPFSNIDNHVERDEAWQTLSAVFRTSSPTHRGLNEFLVHVADTLEKLAQLPTEPRTVVGPMSIP